MAKMWKMREAIIPFLFWFCLFCLCSRWQRSIVELFPPSFFCLQFHIHTVLKWMDIFLNSIITSQWVDGFLNSIIMKNRDILLQESCHAFRILTQRNTAKPQYPLFYTWNIYHCKRCCCPFQTVRSLQSHSYSALSQKRSWNLIISILVCQVILCFL